MAQSPTNSLPPMTEEAFYADRKAFFGSFISFSTVSAGAIVLLLVAMLVFLV
jgi:hypothetical protein